MEREEIFEQMKAVLAERFEIDVSAVTPETTQTDLGIDSILLVDLMMEIEERLGIRFENFDLPKNPKLGDIVTVIEGSIGRQG